MKQKLVIIGLIVGLALMTISYVDLIEEYDTLELNYGYAMEMAKMNLDGSTEEVKKKVFESKKDNILI